MNHVWMMHEWCIHLDLDIQFVTGVNCSNIPVVRYLIVTIRIRARIRGVSLFKDIYSVDFLSQTSWLVLEFVSRGFGWDFDWLKSAKSAKQSSAATSYNWVLLQFLTKKSTYCQIYRAFPLRAKSAWHWKMQWNEAKTDWKWKCKWRWNSYCFS